ncbi:MAG: primary-amine oxidase [Candidatus Acidiferrales bacterium]
MFTNPAAGPLHPRRLLRFLALAFALLVGVQAWAADHPLDPLSQEEIVTTVQVLTKAGKVTGASRYLALELREPSKAEVLKFKPGAPFSRQAFVVVHEHATRKSFEAVVDLNTKQLVSWTELHGVQPPIPGDEEIEIMKKALRADTRWQEALGRRGITDLDAVTVDPWPVGFYGLDDEMGARMVNAIPYYKGRAVNYYARPIEGLRALVDLDTGRVMKVVDTGVVPIAKATADLDPNSIGHQRKPPTPLHIEQPDGPSYLRNGNEVKWQNWVFRFSLHQREGLVLRTVGYEDNARVRPILYRGSVSELLVPYADPGPNWYFRNVFDGGEVGLGWLTVSQEPLTDCPPNAEFFDAAVANEFGKPVSIPRAIALYERDGGLLWKHDDYDSHTNESRRGRELVLSSVATIGNYDYVFNWVFHQDGTLEMEVLLTGIMEPKGTAATKYHEHAGPTHEHLVAPNVAAVHHQHFLSFRLDLDVDGAAGNSVVEMNTETVPTGLTNPYGREFVMNETVLANEKDAIRQLNLASNRTWKVINPGVHNALGAPVGYALLPGENSVPFNSPDSYIRKRAGFISAPFWVTPYDPAEMHAAGEYPNQSPGGDGLPKWTAANRSIENQDVVVWYTLGITHIPRPEEWPVMPAHKAGFKLVPVNFFSRNPALEVPKPQ